MSRYAITVLAERITDGRKDQLIREGEEGSGCCYRILRGVRNGRPNSRTPYALCRDAELAWRGERLRQLEQDDA
jgi:hypothetical protein